jgi:hypothetical protein
MTVVSGARLVFVAVVAVVAGALGAMNGCAFHSPRYVVADPTSVPSKNDAYWQVRPRANLDCAPWTPDGGAPGVGGGSRPALCKSARGARCRLR